MRILVVMKNWLGDLLFQLPAIEIIKKRYPNAEITCIAPKRCAEILKANPLITETIIFDEKKEHKSWFTRLMFIRELKKRGPWDEGYLFHRSRTRAFILFAAGIKKRYGYGNKRKLFLTRSIKEPKRSMHHVDYFVKLMEELGFEVPKTARYKFYYKKEDEETADQILKEANLEENSFVCFHLGANWEPKRWPAFYFANLSDQIYQRWGVSIVVTGTKEDETIFKDFRKNVTVARIISLVGKTGLGVLGVIYKKAAFIVSADSGPMHIASGVGASVVALFGPTDPDLTGPRGDGEKIILHYVPPGYRVPWTDDNFPQDGWMEHILPKQVIDAIEHEKWPEKLNKKEK